MLYFKKDLLSKPRIPLLSEIPIQIPGTTPIPPLGKLVSEILDIKGFLLDVYKKTKTSGEEIFDLQCIAMPITVRGRKERDTIQIVVMNDRPIWVIGMCIDNRVKVTSNTRKILKLSFQRSH